MGDHVRRVVRMTVITFDFDWPIISELGSNWTTLCVLASFMDENGEGCPSQQMIADAMGITRQAANKRITELLAYKHDGKPIVIAEPSDTQFGPLNYWITTENVRIPAGNDNAVTGFSRYNSPELSEKERVALRRVDGYAAWVRAVKDRAGWSCVKCGSDSELVAHHKDNYRDFPDGRTDIDNGACLCKSCHTNLHHIFGWAGVTAEHFEMFMEGRFE